MLMQPNSFLSSPIRKNDIHKSEVDIKMDDKQGVLFKRLLLEKGGDNGW